MKYYMISDEELMKLNIDLEKYKEKELITGWDRKYFVDTINAYPETFNLQNPTDETVNKIIDELINRANRMDFQEQNEELDDLIGQIVYDLGLAG